MSRKVKNISPHEIGKFLAPLHYSDINIKALALGGANKFSQKW